MKIVVIIVLLVVGAPVVLYFLWAVHKILNVICIRHARKYCASQGLDVKRAQYQPEFGKDGIKTEFTLVRLDCLDAQKERRLIILQTWLFGVRKKLRDERYPSDYDQQWPEESRAITGKSSAVP